MKKFFALAAAGLCTLPSLAAADSSLGFRLRVGYYLGSSFKLNSGADGHLNGAQVALDFPISHTRNWELAFTPQLVLGGAFAHGSDTDGQIYKFLLSGKSWINRDLYARIEAGFAHTEARNNEFQDVNDFVTGVSLGFRLNKTPRFVDRLNPSLEISTYLSKHRQLNGIVFSVAFAF